ncbi:DUF1697 domain-containing protein [Nonomuraea sp. NPDC050663]|uniref:DUF1697 domain-containing protein n=1 Tax=Nonomuraea sp. NPDC050663 TaxID=3364370 RepID=UPI00378AF1AE
MPKYAVLVRGVNLKQRNRLVMAEFRELLQGLGHTAVTTYLNSGNAIIEAPEARTDHLAAAIRAALREQLGLDVGVVVRTGPELAAVVEANPFPVADPALLRVAFLSDQPSIEVDRDAVAPEEFHLGDRVLYLKYGGNPRGSKLGLVTRACLRATPELVITERNWNTTLALADRTGVNS